MRVIERAEAVREVGAGLQISPNGMAVLDALGVGGAVAARARRAQAVALADGLTGREILRMDLASLTDARPWLLVHRADLVATLADAAEAAGVTFDFGRTVDSLDPAPGGVRLSFAAGPPETLPVVVAADGVRSVARRALPDLDENAFTGQVAWRAIAPLADPVEDVPRVFMGPGRHLVAYPLRDGRQMNIVAVQERRAWAEVGWTHRDDPENLRAAFADFAPAVRGLLEGIGGVHVWGLFRHRVPATWHEGGLICIGDAVHPTLPFLAQGACMAIEDAWVLAEEMDRTPDTAAAFAAVERRRLARCRRIVAGADTNARLYHLRGPARPVAHAILRAMGPDFALRRLDWLYRTNVTGGAAGAVA